MELQKILFATIYLLAGLMIITPVFLAIGIQRYYKGKRKFISYLVLATILTAALDCTLAWWDDKSTELLLIHYGGLTAMNDNGDVYYQFTPERVAPENKKIYRRLEIHYLGVSWGLRAIMWYFFYFPYMVLVYPILKQLVLFRDKIRQKKRKGTGTR